MAVLRLVPSQGSPVPIEVTRERMIVGREPTCDVVVSDGSVSRKHAILEQRGNGWAVVDQGSANGTFLDSQRVADAVLKAGQQIRFGAVAFRVDIEGEDDFAPTMVATPGPYAPVAAPAELLSTPPLGVPAAPARTPARPAAPPPPLPKAGPPPLTRPPTPAPSPPTAPAPRPPRRPPRPASA